MCGIFMAINTDGLFSAEEFVKFKNLTDLVQYRGPDDAGYLAINGKSAVSEGGRFNIFMGHRRLSIIDLSSAGHQPMADGDDLWLVFNGEIFNYIELREELRSHGHCFTTETDSEVILKLYREYGEAGFARMNGMWALALVDLGNQRVVISRDRFSIKPLYLAQIGQNLYFSSEIKQLLPLLPSVQPNIEVMSIFLDQRLLDHREDTFYQGIFRLPPATNQVLDMKTGRSSRATYWGWSEINQPASGDIVEQFRGLLLDSIRIRLRSDVKLGVLLSGGLDSSAIAVLTHLLVGDVATYSVISDRDCSEERYMDAVTSALGCSNLKIRTEVSGALKSVHQVLYHSDEPFASFSMAAQFQLMQGVREQSDCRVLLSGQGADEVLLGYLKYYFFYLQELAKNRQFARAAGEVMGAVLHGTVLSQFNLGTSRRYRRTAGRRDHLRTIGDRVKLWERSDVRSKQIADIEKYSVPALTHYEDRSSMAFALEVRHPFLDYRLVEFAVGLSTQHKIHHGWTKHVLRKAFPELPQRVRWRRDKQGFDVPEAVWLKQDLVGMIEGLFNDSVLAEMGVLDAQKYLTFYREYRAGSNAIWHNEITRVLIAELWARQFRSCNSNARSDLSESNLMRTVVLTA